MDNRNGIKPNFGFLSVKDGSTAPHYTSVFKTVLRLRKHKHNYTAASQFTEEAIIAKLKTKAVAHLSSMGNI